MANNNNKSIQVKTKNGTLQVRRLPDGFQVIAASNDLQVIHSMNLTDEAMMSLNFCVGYLVTSEGLAKSEPKVAQVASKPKARFDIGDILIHKINKQQYKVYGIHSETEMMEVKSLKTGDTYIDCDPKYFEKISVRKKPKSSPAKVTVEFFNIRWRESDNRTGELPTSLVATLKDDQSKAERDLLFAKKFKCLPIGYEFGVIKGGKK